VTQEVCVIGLNEQQQKNNMRICTVCLFFFFFGSYCMHTWINVIMGSQKNSYDIDSNLRGAKKRRKEREKQQYLIWSSLTPHDVKTILYMSLFTPGEEIVRQNLSVVKVQIGTCWQ
jgi:hypothetical protein